MAMLLQLLSMAMKNSYFRYVPYVVGVSMIIFGACFTSDKILAVLFVVSGFIILVTSPFFHQGENQRKSDHKF